MAGHPQWNYKLAAPGDCRYSAIRTLFLSLPTNSMNTFPSQISKRASKGAALLIVLAFVVLLTGLAVAYFSRTTTDRQLAQSSFNDTTADLLARSALDIVVGDLKQERASAPSVPTSADIQPRRDGSDASIPNLIRRSYSGDLTGRTSTVSSTAVS